MKKSPLRDGLFLCDSRTGNFPPRPRRSGAGSSGTPPKGGEKIYCSNGLSSPLRGGVAQRRWGFLIPFSTPITVAAVVNKTYFTVDFFSPFGGDAAKRQRGINPKSEPNWLFPEFSHFPFKKTTILYHPIKIFSKFG